MLLFAGAAKTRGAIHFTMDVNDAVETAPAFPDAAIVPVHYDGWAHFSQNRDDLVQTFKALGIGERLRLLEPGVPTAIEF
jgi:L-ascorbate metabolism protein UlaG (beta-lactamase superfamily)